MSTALQIQEQASREISPMELIRSAIVQGAGIDTIERLAKLQREMVEYQAKVEFNDGLHRVQQKMTRISADATNPQTKSKYASYAQLDRAVRPIYSGEGFSLSFNTVESPIAEHVRVVCEVSRGGHSKTYQIDMPADGKGAKGGDVMTKTHATGAGVSYGMRYLLKMIFNIAVGEGDNDGNGPGKGEPKLSDERYLELLSWIEGAANLDDLQTQFTTAYREAQAANDRPAMTALIAAKDRRKAELK